MTPNGSESYHPTATEIRTIRLWRRFSAGVRALAKITNDTDPLEPERQLRYRAIVGWCYRMIHSLEHGTGPIASPHERDGDWRRAIRAEQVREDTKVLNKLFRELPKLRKAHPGVVLLWRVGDYYECVDEDAAVLQRYVITANRTFTDRSGVEHVMAGVPTASAGAVIEVMQQNDVDLMIATISSTSSPNGSHPD